MVKWLKYYENIHSCGLKDYKNTSLKEMGIDITDEDFDNTFKEIFLKNIDNF